jgi:replicative DNA helicase
MKSNITHELQDAIIASLIMKPGLSYELNGVGSFMFDGLRKELFDNVVSQINQIGKVDIPLLSKFGVNIHNIIRTTNPANFQNYISDAIEMFRVNQESELANNLLDDLTTLKVSEAVQKHEKQRGLIDELFTSGLTDRKADLLDAMQGITNHVEPTQYKAINDLTRGFMIGGYDIFAARPSMGKTTLMIDFALGLAEKGIPVCLMSLEMSKKLIYAIIACRLSGVHISTIYRSKNDILSMADYEREEHDSDMKKYVSAYDVLSEMPLYVFDVSDTTNKAGGIVNFIRVAQKKHGINYFFIDYLQKIQSGERTANRNYEIEEISGALSRLPVQIGCYIGAFSLVKQGSRNEGR